MVYVNELLVVICRNLQVTQVCVCVLLVEQETDQVVVAWPCECVCMLG
jgi:hypothetical protein